jgi:hypothetical protein
MRKKFSILLTLILTTFLTLSVTSPALAGVSSGGGSGSASGGGGGNDALKWHYYGPNLSNLTSPLGNIWSGNAVYGDDPSVTGIPNRDGYTAPNGPLYVAKAMRQLQSACQSPNVIAVFGQANTNTSERWTQFSWWAKSPNWNDPLTYAALADLSGVPSEAQTQLRNTPGYIGEKTVVCVTADGIKEWREAPTYTSVNLNETITCIYSRATSIKRQISENGIDPIGENNLEDQGSLTAANKTAFGDLVDQFNAANPKPDPVTAKTQLDAACAASQGETRSNLTLSDNNKKGLAEGGVLNVSEFSKSATYTTTQSYEEFQSCTSYEWVSYDNGLTWSATGTTKACSNTYPPRLNDTGVNATLNLMQSQNLTGFWQIISVHCNKADWDNLMNEVNGEEIQTTQDGAGYYSAVAYSQLYTSVPAKLDFGDSSNPAGTAQQKSGTLAFYDKECSFTCTADPNSPTATAENGATTNLRATAPAGGTVGKYGAVSDKSNNNKFEFFRDNIAKTVTLDVWYPKNGDGVTYNGAAPTTTTINRWVGGTPSIDGSSGGKFTMIMGGQELFQGRDALATQKDWDTTALNSSTAQTLNGLQRTFTVQASWASDTDKPHVLNFKWEYAVNIATRIPTTEIGFTSTGQPSRGGITEVAMPVQGKCYAQFGTDTSTDTRAAFIANTGNGTENNLDGKLYQGDTTTKPLDDPNNLFINFVRSTTE